MPHSVFFFFFFICMFQRMVSVLLEWVSSISIFKVWCAQDVPERVWWRSYRHHGRMEAPASTSSKKASESWPDRQRTFPVDGVGRSLGRCLFSRNIPLLAISQEVLSAFRVATSARGVRCRAGQPLPCSAYPKCPNSGLTWFLGSKPMPRRYRKNPQIPRKNPQIPAKIRKSGFLDFGHFGKLHFCWLTMQRIWWICRCKDVGALLLPHASCLETW